MKQIRTMPWVFILVSSCLFFPPNTPLISSANAESTHHHRTYLALKKSMPAAERRLANWQKLARKEAHTLNHSNHAKLVLWRRQMAGAAHKTEFEMLKSVNALINRDVDYLSDWEHEGRDFWEGPVETLEEGGDCEDYALLKATSLLRLGWPEKHMHLVAGILPGGEGHMMLTVELKNGERWLLDNLTSRVHRWPLDSWTPIYEVGGHKGALRFIELKPKKKS